MRLLGLVQVLDVGPELVAGLRIEAERGLVEKQDLGRVQESAGDFQAALHASGKCLDVIVPAFPELEQFQQLFDALRALLARDLVEHGVQFHVLVGGLLAVEAGVLEHDPELSPGFILVDCRDRGRPVRLFRWWDSAAW